jgi:cellulose biosynthesis protein BcsQ
MQKSNDLQIFINNYSLKHFIKMEKQTLLVAFSTQKGGMGKTAVTVLTASYLHYVKGYRVAIVDCDFPQHSIIKERKRDEGLIIGNDYFKWMAFEMYRTGGVKAYRVKDSTAEKAIEDARALIENTDKPFDVVFFDLPGTLNSKGVVQTLSAMDYIFTPISADRFVLESTLQYATMLNDNIISMNRGNLKGLHLFWNMVDSREKTPLYEAYENAIGELGLQIMKTSLPNSVRFRKEMSEDKNSVFRSTLFPADKSLLKGSRIDELADEICEILKLKHDGEK